MEKKTEITADMPTGTVVGKIDGKNVVRGQDRVHIDFGNYRLELPLPDNHEERLLIQQTIRQLSLYERTENNDMKVLIRHGEVVKE